MRASPRAAAGRSLRSARSIRAAAATAGRGGASRERLPQRRSAPALERSGNGLRVHVEECSDADHDHPRHAGAHARAAVQPLAAAQACVALALAMLLLAATVYHFVLLKAAREGWPLVSQLVNCWCATSSRSATASCARTSTRWRTNVGEMQAKLIKLEAMGDRVSGMAGVKPEELKPVCEAARGRGAGRSVRAGVAVGRDPLEQLNGIVGELDVRTDQHTDLFTRRDVHPSHHRRGSRHRHPGAALGRDRPRPRRAGRRSPGSPRPAPALPSAAASPTRSPSRLPCGPDSHHVLRHLGRERQTYYYAVQARRRRRRLHRLASRPRHACGRSCSSGNGIKRRELLPGDGRVEAPPRARRPTTASPASPRRRASTRAGRSTSLVRPTGVPLPRSRSTAPATTAALKAA